MRSTTSSSDRSPPRSDPSRRCSAPGRAMGEASTPRWTTSTTASGSTFDHVGDAFLQYVQRSWLAADGTPLHFERGFLRPGGRGGRRGADPGSPTRAWPRCPRAPSSDGAMSLVSTSMGRTGTGMAVVGVERRYRIGEDEIAYEIDMATETHADDPAPHRRPAPGERMSTAEGTDALAYGHARVRPEQGLAGGRDRRHRRRAARSRSPARTMPRASRGRSPPWSASCRWPAMSSPA